jgi:hypothetical protein
VRGQTPGRNGYWPAAASASSSRLHPRRVGIGGGGLEESLERGARAVGLLRAHVGRAQRDQKPVLVWRRGHGFFERGDSSRVIAHTQQRQAKVVERRVVVREQGGGHAIVRDRLRPAIEQSVRPCAVESIRPALTIEANRLVEVRQRFRGTTQAHQQLAKVVSGFRIVGRSGDSRLQLRQRGDVVTGRVRRDGFSLGVRRGKRDRVAGCFAGRDNRWPSLFSWARRRRQGGR